jgi:hypothetical protein
MDADRRRQYAELAARLRLAATQEEPVSEGTLVIPAAAADIGNATALIAAVIDGKVRLVELPTAKAVFGLRLPAKLERDDVIYQNGANVPVALGLSALRYADEPIAARGHSDRYGPFTKEFALAGLGLLGRARAIVVERLAVLLPEKHATADVLGRLTKELGGDHAFTLGGWPVALRVRRVVPTHEGAAAWHLLAAPHAGNSIVIDGGGGTTNVALGRGGKFHGVRTRDTGLQRAWDTLDDLLRRERNGRALTAAERYELERALIVGRPYELPGVKKLRVDETARALLAPVAAAIAADVKEIVPKWRAAEAVYYAGGQALHLGALMRAEFDGHLITAPRPVEANVRGALAMLGAAVEESADASA